MLYAVKIKVGANPAGVVKGVVASFFIQLRFSQPQKIM
jgi:hypothetical protein